MLPRTDVFCLLVLFQVGNISMLRDYRAQLKELKATAGAAAAAAASGTPATRWADYRDAGGAENVDPGSRSRARPGAAIGKNGGRSSGGSGSVSSKDVGSSVGEVADVDTFEGQAAVLEALVQETEKVNVCVCVCVCV